MNKKHYLQIYKHVTLIFFLYFHLIYETFVLNIVLGNYTSCTRYLIINILSFFPSRKLFEFLVRRLKNTICLFANMLCSFSLHVHIMYKVIVLML